MIGGSESKAVHVPAPTIDEADGVICPMSLAKAQVAYSVGPIIPTPSDIPDDVIGGSDSKAVDVPAPTIDEADPVKAQVAYSVGPIIPTPSDIPHDQAANVDDMPTAQASGHSESGKKKIL